MDAAWAGNAAILPELRHHFDGIELVDSFVTNPAKRLLENFDCSALWVRDSAPLKDALGITRHYLRSKGNELGFKVRCYKGMDSLILKKS